MNSILKKITFMLVAGGSFISCGNVALTGSNSGSLIDDRSGGLIMTFIVLLVALLGAVTAVFVISKKISAYKNSPEYLEKQKKKPTSARDISEIARLANLSKSEKELLGKLCKIKKTPNITYLVKETSEIELMLRAEFEHLDSAKDEEAKVILFSLRKKILRTFKQQIVIKNTKALEPGTIFTYTQIKGFHHKLELIQSTPDGLLLSISNSIKNIKDMPEALSKITLVFEDKDNSPYEIETRIVRYQDGKNDSKQVLLVHTDKVVPLKKRQSERIELNSPCKFSSVKVTKNSKGEDSHYEPGEKEHDGTLEDVSTGGCRITTSLPIKPEQYIFIKAKMNKKVMDTAIGTIVRTTKRSENDFILHVRFLKINIATANRIQAVVCGYDN